MRRVQAFDGEQLGRKRDMRNTVKVFGSNWLQHKKTNSFSIFDWGPRVTPIAHH